MNLVFALNDNRLLELKKIVPAVSRETAERLIAFEELFIKWSSVINLASPSTLNSVWTRHILDSAQLINIADPSATKWLDLGSGGGFPGIVLACFLKERAGASIDLVESAGKKAAFLRTAAGHLAVPARIHSERIEKMWGKIDTPQIVTARALASLKDLFSLAEPWLCNGATAVFQKGREFQSELEQAKIDWDFKYDQHVSAIDDSSVILVITDLRRKSR